MKNFYDYLYVPITSDEVNFDFGVFEKAVGSLSHDFKNVCLQKMILHTSSRAPNSSCPMTMSHPSNAIQVLRKYMHIS